MWNKTMNYKENHERVLKLCSLEDNDWQPIETAPKDGTEVLLISVDSSGPNVDMGYWDDYTTRHLWEDGDLEGEWSTDLGMGDPILWMPVNKQ